MWTRTRSFVWKKRKCRRSPYFVPAVPAQPRTGHTHFTVAIDRAGRYVTGRRPSSTRSRLNTNDQKIPCWVLRWERSEVATISSPHMLHPTHRCHHYPKLAWPPFNCYTSPASDMSLSSLVRIPLSFSSRRWSSISYCARSNPPSSVLY